MKTEHLTEMQLQEAAEKNVDVNIHLLICPSCQQKVLTYRLLYNGIGEMEQPVFDFDLSLVVMKALEKPKQPFPIIAVALTIVLVTVITVLGYPYWDNIKALFDAMPLLYLQLMIIPVVTFSLLQGIIYYRQHLQKMRQLKLN